MRKCNPLLHDEKKHKLGNSNKGNIFLTIAIPTYNRSYYLNNALDQFVNLLKKNIDCNDKVEVIVINNNSTDNTQEVVFKYRCMMSNLVYYKNIENIGLENNLIECIKKAKGKYVWVFGDDDFLSKKFDLKYLLEILKNEEPDLLISIDCIKIIKQQVDLSLRSKKPELFNGYKEFLMYIRANKFSRIELAHTWIPTNIFKKEIYDYEATKVTVEYYKWIRGITMSPSLKKIMLLFPHMIDLKKRKKENYKHIPYWQGVYINDLCTFYDFNTKRNKMFVFIRKLSKFWR